MYKLKENIYTSITFNADDEEPLCIRCDNQNICSNTILCGPKYGWRLYERTVGILNNENNMLFPDKGVK